MDYTTLGRTGLEVSVAGLGCGGFSRLGLGTGQSAEHAVGNLRPLVNRIAASLSLLAMTSGCTPLLLGKMRTAEPISLQARLG
jgi:hypothetical protein